MSNQSNIDVTIEQINDLLYCADHKRSCMNKYKHSTMTSAEQEKDRLMKVFVLGDKMEAYKCRYCQYYHVGHSENSPRSSVPTKLLIHIADKVIYVIGFVGYTDPYISAMKCKIRGLPRIDGTYVYIGKLVYSTRGISTLIGIARLLTDDDKNIIWKYYDEKYHTMRTGTTNERVISIGKY